MVNDIWILCQYFVKYPSVIFLLMFYYTVIHFSFSYIFIMFVWVTMHQSYQFFFKMSGLKQWICNLLGLFLRPFWAMRIIGTSYFISFFCTNFALASSWLVLETFLSSENCRQKLFIISCINFVLKSDCFRNVILLVVFIRPLPY